MKDNLKPTLRVTLESPPNRSIMDSSQKFGIAITLIICLTVAAVVLGAFYITVHG